MVPDGSERGEKGAGFDKQEKFCLYKVTLNSRYERRTCSLFNLSVYIVKKYLSCSIYKIFKLKCIFCIPYDDLRYNILFSVYFLKQFLQLVCIVTCYLGDVLQIQKQRKGEETEEEEGEEEEEEEEGEGGGKEEEGEE